MEEYMGEVGQNKRKCENCAVVFLFQKKNNKKISAYVQVKDDTFH